MINYLDTEYYRIDFGWKCDDNYENGRGIVFHTSSESNYLYYTAPDAELHSRYSKFIAYVNTYQFEIKSIMPITTSLCHSYSWSSNSAGLGYGYGASQITGMIALLQRSIPLSEDEYRRAMELQATIFKLQIESKDIQNKIDIYENEDNSYHDYTIKEESKLFGGKTYSVGEYQFKSREEAEAYLGNIKRPMPEWLKKEDYQAILAKNSAALKDAVNELDAIKKKYTPQRIVF